MEKYAVVIDDEKTKTASTENKCPKCGKDLSDQIRKSNIAWYCPNCGTEPFEKRVMEDNNV